MAHTVYRGALPGLSALMIQVNPDTCAAWMKPLCRVKHARHRRTKVTQFRLSEVPRIVKCMGTESSMVDPRVGEGRTGSCCLMGVGLSFGTRESGHECGMAAKQCQCKEGRRTVRLKVVKGKNFIYVHFCDTKKHVAK